MKSAVSATDAIGKIRNGSRIFVHGSAATPRYLLRLLAERSDSLKEIEIVAISTLGVLPIDEAIREGKIFVNSLFVSANIREHVNSPNGSYIPVFLSEIPELFYRNILKLDYALIHVSPPDKHGYCSLGVSVDVARAACINARFVIAQVNPQMPRTHGDGLIHIDQIDAWDYINEPLPEVINEPDDPELVSKIGHICAGLIEDGATLQMGIGAIPNAVLASLEHHKDLGVHTEMFSDGVIPLIEKGVINNRLKKKHPGKVVTGFVLGTRKVYDFIDDNPQVAVLDIDYVNDPNIIRRNPRATSINSGLAIDLTGQVAADTIGTFQFSGFGGQVDFMRGAALSERGNPIMALASVTNKGISKICPFLREGSGVVSTRAHIHHVVTEYGAVDLFGMNLRQRAKALISIAHPDHRESLERAAYQRFG